jgi:hypothetical protein
MLKPSNVAIRSLVQMRTSIILLLVPSVLAISSVAASAETSIACVYMLMRVYHAELDACHVAIPKDREERYSRLRAGMEKFIRENAKNDAEKILSRIETVNIKGALQSLRSCHSADFKFARQTIDQITDGDHEALIKNSLALRRDPMEGDCIN